MTGSAGCPSTALPHAEDPPERHAGQCQQPAWRRPAMAGLPRPRLVRRLALPPHRRAAARPGRGTMPPASPRMQRDTVSPFAQALTGPERAAARACRRSPAPPAPPRRCCWAGTAMSRRTGREPLIFNAWLRRLGRLALAEGGVPAGAWTANAGFLQLVLSPDGGGAAWCGGDCRALAARALAEAVAELQASDGPDPAAWRWGRRHVARFEHPLFRFLPGARPADPAGGGDRRRRMDRARAAACAAARGRSPGRTCMAPGCGWWSTSPIRRRRWRSSPPASPAIRCRRIGAICWAAGGTAGCSLAGGGRPARAAAPDL